MEKQGGCRTNPVGPEKSSAERSEMVESALQAPRLTTTRTGGFERRRFEHFRKRRREEEGKLIHSEPKSQPNETNRMIAQRDA
eukprot:4541271-Amphidinium_carterae.1